MCLHGKRLENCFLPCWNQLPLFLTHVLVLVYESSKNCREWVDESVPSKFPWVLFKTRPYQQTQTSQPLQTHQISRLSCSFRKVWSVVVCVYVFVSVCCALSVGLGALSAVVTFQPLHSTCWQARTERVKWVQLSPVWLCGSGYPSSKHDHQSPTITVCKLF